MYTFKYAFLCSTFLKVLPEVGWHFKQLYVWARLHAESASSRGVTIIPRGASVEATKVRSPASFVHSSWTNFKSSFSRKRVKFSA